MVDLFFSLPSTATLIIVVVENIELDPSNNPAREGLRLSTYTFVFPHLVLRFGPLTKKVAHPYLIILCIIPGMANLFKWWVKFKVADRKKKKTWVTDVIILTRGLNASFAEICVKSKKKDLHLRNTQLPVFNAPLWKNRLFYYVIFFTVFS